MNDPILFWNEVALEVHRRDFAFEPGADGKPLAPQQGGPTKTSRALAIVHIAMYDAWNGANSTGQNYLGVQAGTPALPPLVPGTSPDVAVAAAAATALRNLFNRQNVYIESRLAEFMDSLPATVVVAQRRNGLEYGAKVATILLAHRSGDGSAPNPSVVLGLVPGYVPGVMPGQHRPDPYNPEQGFLDPKWGDVAPFCITPFAPNGTTAAYLPPPPAFNSATYKNHFNEVRDFGAKARNQRTANQEAEGLFWAYDGAKGLGTPPRLYNQIVREIARDKNNTVVQNARLFALVNAGMADAGIVAWRAKYEHKLWRPAVGVREDDSGTGPSGLGTASTAAGDPFWEAYGAPRSNQPGKGFFTPNFPAYPSGHATFGTTVFELVASFYSVAKTALSFDFISDELDGQTLDNDGSARPVVRKTFNLAQAIQSNLESRVWLGVHWRFDGDGGKAAGEQVATQVFASCFP
jgi:Vanadium chloroperoxidase N-terminal domain